MRFLTRSAHRTPITITVVAHTNMRADTGAGPQFLLRTPMHSPNFRATRHPGFARRIHENARTI